MEDERRTSRARGDCERAARMRLSEALGSKFSLDSSGCNEPRLEGGAEFTTRRLGLGVRSSFGGKGDRLAEPLRIMRLEYTRVAGLNATERNVRLASRRRIVHVS